MSSQKQQYGNESISALKGADRVRLRPGVIFGSDGLDGAQHSFFEILANSIDEAREGHGDRIEITRFKDHSILVRDYGRGIPMEYNEKEERWNWELIFCELYAGGKYKEHMSSSNYEFSLGLNGLGACATQYSSEYMDVEVFREGKRYEMHFKKGNPDGKLKKEKFALESTGTQIRWRPDLDVFTEIAIPLEFYRDAIKKQAVVNAGVTFILHDEESGETFEYMYENGIVDYVGELNGENGMTDVFFFEGKAKGKDREDKAEYKMKAQIAFAFNNAANRIEYYHNSSWLEHGGSPERAAKRAFVAELDKYLRKNGKYVKNEKKITFTDIEDSLLLVASSFSTYTSYENQTKKAISNSFIQESMADMIAKELEIIFIENKAVSDKIADQVLVNKRSREKAEKARLSIRKKLGGALDVTNRVKKFVDCRTRDLERRELYIVEGDSALGSCKLGRDAEFQAIIPVRGKILNCLKADYDKIFANAIIVDLLKVLGCGVEIKTKHNKDLNTFDLDHLRWGKVIICTDADVDGYQIRTLILTMLYCLVPTLIREGKVYIAETPLYEISAKGETHFAYTDREKAEIMKKLEGKKVSLQRSKGLGENDPDMMWQTTMNPESRRLIQVLPDSEEKTSESFDVLLGDNLEARKKFIVDHGEKYIEMADVS